MFAEVAPFPNFLTPRIFVGENVTVEASNPRLQRTEQSSQAAVPVVEATSVGNMISSRERAYRARCCLVHREHGKDLLPTILVPTGHVPRLTDCGTTMSCTV
jgi:hypothetical protein